MSVENPINKIKTTISKIFPNYEISEKMKEQCNDQFRNKLGEFDSSEIEIEWFNCNNKAEEWKKEHMS